MARLRAAVTGLGVVSCVGRGPRAFWRALLERRCGISPVKSFPAGGYRSRLGGEILGPGPRSAAAYVREAAREALADAGLDRRCVDPLRAGVALGTTQGEAARIEAVVARRRGGGRARLWREAFPSFPGGIPAGLARELGWRGPNIMFTTACAAGNFALAYAFEKISRGRAGVMLAGGVDVFNQAAYAGFSRLLAVAPRECAPFSPGREGLIPAEGCAVLVLEELSAARRRGARVYAELLGWGASCDARHVVAPDADGVARAMAECLRDSGLKPGQVDYISAHGTGTPANDKTETAAVKRVFGARAARVPISSLKAVLGHAMGAASALEAAACCLALRTGILPPTANFRPGDPDCDLDYVPEGPRRTSPKVVLSNGLAFGGSNAVIALARPGFRDAAPRLRPPGGDARLVITGLASAAAADPRALAGRLLPGKDLRFVDKPMALALAAATMALRDAGLEPERSGEDIGIVLDSSGELEGQIRFYCELLERGPAAVEPMMFPAILANAAASRAAVLLGLKLLNESIAGSFPGGEMALACACDFLGRRGRGIVLAGGAWSADGLRVVPEGGVMFVLETRKGARARGARMYAEVFDWQESFDPAGKGGRVSAQGLLDAVLAASRGRSALIHEARGLWGGVITLSLAPCRGVEKRIV